MRKGLVLGFGGRKIEDDELEKGEACSYNNNNDDYDASTDPEVDLSSLAYIDEKLQHVLEHLQKDVERAKFGGYASFLLLTHILLVGLTQRVHQVSFNASISQKIWHIGQVVHITEGWTTTYKFWTLPTLKAPSNDSIEQKFMTSFSLAGETLLSPLLDYLLNFIVKNTGIERNKGFHDVAEESVELKLIQEIGWESPKAGSALDCEVVDPLNLKVIQRVTSHRHTMKLPSARTMPHLVEKENQKPGFIEAAVTLEKRLTVGAGVLVIRISWKSSYFGSSLFNIFISY
ncbi:hypothetical protein F3Y22_tig00111096pilonHSYRG00029 [Hibiscus syriacus]|uniref:Uncharacterized protein n=1 Tax=Hibiscus syriacus TaxID=106335 RepID=A0A6A2Z0T1_HIBSY|nr:hypothetical protein F3Y22_tig00111096pilonHSYRG00029 [Hibiscus syriacus]